MPWSAGVHAEPKVDVTIRQEGQKMTEEIACVRCLRKISLPGLCETCIKINVVIETTFRAHRAPLLRYVRALSWSGKDPEAVVQETFTRMIERWTEIEN